MTRTIKAFAMLFASTAIALAAVGSADAKSGGGNHSGPVHGPGSSHNPIVYHPVHGPGSSHNPIVATKPVVRDHRNHGGPPRGGGPYHGGPSPEGGVTVTSGRNRVPARVGDGGRVYAVPGNGLYNPPAPIVRDHR